MWSRCVLTCCSAGTLLIMLAGCQESTYQPYSDGLAGVSDHSHAGARSHSDHPGRHGGHVFELDSSHGHHAEMVFDPATRNITLYFYGREIGVPRPATGLAFEMKKGEREVVIPSRPFPLPGETETTASRYLVPGEQIPESITSEEQLDGHFHIVIDGREYIGSFRSHQH